MSDLASFCLLFPKTNRSHSIKKLACQSLYYSNRVVVPSSIADDAIPVCQCVHLVHTNELTPRDPISVSKVVFKKCIYSRYRKFV
jgi:hypothetical protein